MSSSRYKTKIERIIKNTLRNYNKNYDLDNEKSFAINNNNKRALQLLKQIMPNSVPKGIKNKSNNDVNDCLEDVKYNFLKSPKFKRFSIDNKSKVYFFLNEEYKFHIKEYIRNNILGDMVKTLIEYFDSIDDLITEYTDTGLSIDYYEKFDLNTRLLRIQFRENEDSFEFAWNYKMFNRFNKDANEVFNKYLITSLNGKKTDKSDNIHLKIYTDTNIDIDEFKIKFGSIINPEETNFIKNDENEISNSKTVNNEVFTSSSKHEEAENYDEEFESGGIEGGKKCRYVTYYERDTKNRDIAVEKHSYTCKACGFNFEKKYGQIGANYIHVHHIKPISEQKEKIKINPETDLIVLCANCHSMIHRNKHYTLSVDELKNIISKNE